MSRLPTDPIRHEHMALIPHLQELERAAADVREWRKQAASDRLEHIIDFLSDHLLPHAAAEEEVLYPAIDEAMGAPGATATMKVDHEEIAARVTTLRATVGAALDTWPDPEQVGQLSRQLSALAAIILLHFRKEEEVLLPVLDAALTVEEARALFEGMDIRHHQHA
jgi:iron-sulfur cluster repair protein YtfE (RIC family)